MKFIKYTTMAAAIAMVIAASAAQASPFKLPSLLGGKGSPQTSDQAGDPATAQDALVRTFVASQLEVLAAQSELAKAYDLKDQAAILDSEGKVLGGGGTLDAAVLQTSMERSQAASDAISAKQAASSELTAEGKQHYTASLPHFAKGVVGTRELVVQMTHFTSAMKGSMTGGGLAGLAGGVGKLKAGIVVAKGTPAYSRNVFDMFRKTMSIGQSNGVKAPADATSALGSMAP
jgi:hypothetical protein